MKLHPLHIVVLSAAIIANACNSSEPTSSTPPPTAVKTNTPALPAGHPPIDFSATKLPPGHPPIDMSAQSLPASAMAKAKDPQWTVPADWKPGRVSSMRRGSFKVTGAEGQSADIAITVFPGAVGGLLPNVNRWRDQIGLSAVTANEVKGMTTNVDCNGIASTVVDFANTTALAGKTQPQRMIVATIPHAGDSWFVKMTGDAPLVGAQKEAFLKFVQSVKF